MNAKENIIEDIKWILDCYKKHDISAAIAKNKLLYMISTSKTIAELKAAQEAYEQVSKIYNAENSSKV